jgi:uncharacterized protein YxjI
MLHIEERKKRLTKLRKKIQLWNNNQKTSKENFRIESSLLELELWTTKGRRMNLTCHIILIPLFQEERVNK